MYIWHRLAYPHRQLIIGCVRSFSSRKWQRSSNNTAVGSAAAVDGVPKSTPEIGPSPSKNFIAVAWPRKNDQLHSGLETVNLPIGKYSEVRNRNHEVVSKDQYSKTGTVDEVQNQKHSVVDFRPGKSKVANIACTQNMVETESLKKAHPLEETRMALASHCTTVNDSNRTIQPRTGSTPDKGYFQRRPMLHDGPHDGKSSQIEVSPDGSEDSLSLNSTTSMGHVSSFGSGAASAFAKRDYIKRIRAKRATMREQKFASNEPIIGTNTLVRFHVVRPPKEENVNYTNQEHSLVSPSKFFARERKREQALHDSSPPAPEMRAATGWGEIIPMRPEIRKIWQKKVRPLRSQFERTRSQILQARRTPQNGTTHVESNGMEPNLIKYIFNDEKKAKQDTLTEKVLTGLNDLLYTYNELQLRKPREDTRDNAVKWPSRSKYMRWQRLDETGQPLGEAPENPCAAETVESNFQTIVEPQVPTLGGKLDIEDTTETSYQPDDVRPEASFSDGHAARESVGSDHQAEIDLPRIRLAYNLENPLHLAS